MRRHAALATIERRVGDRATVQAGLGAVLAGDVDVDGGAYRLLAGPIVTVAASYRFLDERAARPFVLGSLSLGASTVGTRARDAAAATETMTALDGRVGLAVGKTFGVASPYVTARAFGLPIFWRLRDRAVVGTDAFHYQLGGGVAVRLGRADLVLEGIPLGEQAILAGAGVSF